MKMTFKTIQFEKHLRRNWRCPRCYCRYLILTRYEDTKTWTAECKSCGEYTDEYPSKRAALNAWYDLVDEAEAQERKQALRTEEK